MTATISTVLFDVDGTLVDSNYLHTLAWWEAFGQAGHTVPMAAIHRAVGMGSDKLLDALLPTDRDQNADDDIRAAHSALYGTFRRQLLRPEARPRKEDRAIGGLVSVIASAAMI